MQFDFEQKANKDTGKLEDVETTMSFSQSLNHSDFWFATKMESPIKKPALSSAHASLFWVNGVWDLWARGAFIRGSYGAGATYR